MLGSIDEDIGLPLIRQGTSEGLYVDVRGLYLLPAPVHTGGRVTEICVFGYQRAEHQHLFIGQNGEVNLGSTRVFVYITLYRPVDEMSTGYEMKYKPTVIYHALKLGCVSRDDGLNWEVEGGELLGAFIPDNCTALGDILSNDDVDIFHEREELRSLETFCPSQVNLNRPADCSYALFLKNSEGTTLLEQIESFDIEQVVNVSTRLNIRMTIEKGIFNSKQFVC